MPADRSAFAERDRASCPVCHQRLVFLGLAVPESTVDCPTCANELEVVDTEPVVLAVAVETGY
jgi:C4-type Zn-finger protein